MQSGSDIHKSVPPLCLDVSVQCPGQGVRTALSELVRALHDCKLTPEETATVQLVLAEILNNVIEHAFAPGTDFVPITIRAELQHNGLHLTIRDRGRPMPDGKLPIGALPSIDVEMNDLPEGGFGWFLIQDLARDVTYCREETENILNLRIAVGATAQA